MVSRTVICDNCKITRTDARDESDPTILINRPRPEVWAKFEGVIDDIPFRRDLCASCAVHVVNFIDRGCSSE